MKTNTITKFAVAAMSASALAATVATVPASAATSTTSSASSVITNPAIHSQAARASVASGVSCSGGCHAWFTASYNDFARGAAYGAIYAGCMAFIHAPTICSTAAYWAQSAARGWGGGSNHGVWGAIYANGHIAGGRW